MGEYEYACSRCSFRISGVTDVQALVDLVKLHDLQRHSYTQ